MIKHIRHQDIDKKKWDHTVQNATNVLPYTCSWYLDIVSLYWDALVLDDYEAVMPLTWNRKFGIFYLFQPYFTQQLGVFSAAGCPADLVHAFLAAIPDQFRYIEIQLNEGNDPAHKDFNISERKNYTLSLYKPYDAICKDFNRNCRRNISKAESAGLLVKTGMQTDHFISFIHKNLSHQLKNADKKIYDLLALVVKATRHNGKGDILSVHSPDGKPVAAGWFMIGTKRLVFQVCASSREGKENQAMYMLVNHVIKRNADSGMVFDFSGSTLPGVAYFNYTFGATPSSYYAVHCNRLPHILKIFKK